MATALSEDRLRGGGGGGGDGAASDMAYCASVDPYVNMILLFGNFPLAG